MKPPTTTCCVLLILWTLSRSLHAQTFSKWVAVGDSITLHGPKADLQWTGESRGMAASGVSKDYVHLLEARLKAVDAGNAGEVKIVGRIGKLSGGTIDQMSTVLGEVRALQADLVTIQLGENDHLSEIGKEGFEQRYRLLVDALLSGPKKPVVVCTGVWEPASNPGSANYADGSDAAVKDAIIEKICREKGLRFVSIASAALNPADHGDGATDGVRWHPNDAGMKAYAEAIFAALYPGR